jgi:hypothetical protein
MNGLYLYSFFTQLNSKDKLNLLFSIHDDIGKQHNIRIYNVFVDNPVENLSGGYSITLRVSGSNSPVIEGYYDAKHNTFDFWSNHFGEAVDELIVKKHIRKLKILNLLL